MDASPPRGWGLLLLLTLMYGFVGLNRVSIAYVFPLIIPAFHLQYWQAGLLVSVTSGAWVISTWIGGHLSDRRGRRPVLAWGLTGAAVVTALTGAAPGFLSLVALRTLVGFGDGVGWSVGQSLVFETAPTRHRGLAQGLMTGGYTLIGSGIGALVVTKLAAQVGWRPLFPGIGLLLLIVTAWLWLVLPHRQPHSGERGPGLVQGLGQLLRMRAIYPLMAMSVCTLGWLQVLIGFNTLFLTRVYHLTLAEAGVVGSLSGFVGFVGQLLVPHLSDRMGRRKSLMAAGALSAITLGLYTFIRVPPLWIAVLSALSGFAGYGLLPVATATAVAEQVPPALVGAATGWINAVGGVFGALVMPLVAGVVAGGMGLTAALGLAVVLQLAIVPLAFALGETAPLALAQTRRAGEEQLPAPL